MKRTTLTAAMHEAVADRAAYQCEYCRFPSHAAFFTFEIEHIIAEKHGGRTALDTGLSLL